MSVAVVARCWTVGHDRAFGVPTTTLRVRLQRWCIRQFLELPRHVWVPLGEVLDDPGAVEQIAEVRFGQRQFQRVLAVGLLDHQQVSAEQFLYRIQFLRQVDIIHAASPRRMRRCAQGVERLFAEEPQDALGLAAAGPASAVGRMVLTVAFVGSARAPRSLRARFADEDVLCCGFFMVSCIVPSRPRGVSQETVQRTGLWNWRPHWGGRLEEACLDRLNMCLGIILAE